MSLPYVVWAPPYHENSGGIKVIHWFVHELNRLGHEAYIAWIPGGIRGNPEWVEPVWDGREAIAVYPDTQWGNPLGLDRTARWAMNIPGRLPMMAYFNGRWVELPPGSLPTGMEWGEGPNDLVFPFARAFNQWGLPEDRILYVPIRELDAYSDWGVKRNKGACFYVGKGADTPRIPEIDRLDELDKDSTHDLKALARFFNRHTVLYSYDTQTGLTDIARLCGCPVVLIPNSHTTREQVYAQETGADGIGWGFDEEQKAIDTVDAAGMRRHMEWLMDEFRRKLSIFVELTQALG